MSSDGLKLIFLWSVIILQTAFDPPDRFRRIAVICDNLLIEIRDRLRDGRSCYGAVF